MKYLSCAETDKKLDEAIALLNLLKKRNQFGDNTEIDEFLKSLDK